MTREEAIINLEVFKSELSSLLSAESKQAIDLAIAALRQPCTADEAAAIINGETP